MYRLYVRYKGIFALVEEFNRVEEVYSKIDRYIEEGYEEVVVLNESMGYVMGKKREENKGKVLKKKK